MAKEITQKTLKKARARNCPFESDIIPDGMQAEIHEALKLCVSEEEVNRVLMELMSIQAFRICYLN